MYIFFFFIFTTFDFAQLEIIQRKCLFVFRCYSNAHLYIYIPHMFDNVLNFPNYMVKGDRISIHVVSSIETCDHFTIIS